jgi:hypothetical protein
MAIWSLGEIGGVDAQRALLDLADSTTDEDLRASIEDAISMAALSLGEFGLYIREPEIADDEFNLLDQAGELTDDDDFDADAIS